MAFYVHQLLALIIIFPLPQQAFYDKNSQKHFQRNGRHMEKKLDMCQVLNNKKNNGGCNQNNGKKAAFFGCHGESSFF
jgi:hypothetical protein